MGTKQKETTKEDEEDFYFEDWKTSSSKKNKTNIVLDNNIIISKNINSNVYDNYVVLKEIGTGTYSKVLLVQHKINLSIRAMKVIKKKTKNKFN